MLRTSDIIPIPYGNLIGDSWNNMRSTLERVFSHESAMKSIEETKQYEILITLALLITMGLSFCSIIEEYMKQLETR